jgi:hypothetical protein
MRWHSSYDCVRKVTRTLQQQWGSKNGWAWSNLEWRDVPEVWE